MSLPTETVGASAFGSKITAVGGKGG